MDGFPRCAFASTAGAALLLSACFVTSCGTLSEEGADPPAVEEAQEEQEIANASGAQEQAPEEPTLRQEEQEASKTGTSCDPPPSEEPAPNAPNLQQEPVSISPSSALLLDQTNACRMQGGVGALAFDAALGAAAQERATEMAAARMPGHTRPDGSSCFTVLSEYGIACDNAGENVASGFQSARAACEAFCGSPEHYENMMNPIFTKIGTGMAKDSHGVCYWVQLFSD